MQSLELVTAPSLARAAGCSIATVFRRVGDGTLVPDGWLQGASTRQPVFRVERVDALRTVILPTAPHLRVVCAAEDSESGETQSAAAVCGAVA